MVQLSLQLQRRQFVLSVREISLTTPSFSMNIFLNYFILLMIKRAQRGLVAITTRVISASIH